MIEFLKSERIAPPRAVTTDVVADRKTEGTVTVSFPRGALILRNARGERVRLSWEDADDQAGPRRALPAGDYTLTGYRIQRRDKKGVEWHISATKLGMRKVTVKPGQNVKVKIDPTIRMGDNLMHRMVGMTIQGQFQSGLSIYKDSKRIPIDYRLTDRRGSVIASGRMKYG